MQTVLESLLPPKNYYSIGEVSRVTRVKTYVLRYWETEFGLLRPARRESGQRKFTQRDIDLIFRIKDLLYQHGFTIEGAKRELVRQARRKKSDGTPAVEAPDAASATLSVSLPSLPLLRELRKDLEEVAHLLKG